MTKSPAFQFYPDKWETHTAHLSDYAYRVYHRIICWMWQHSEDNCSIKADNAAIAIVLAQPCERIANAMQEINNEHMPLLKKRGDRWVSGGLKKEAEKQKDRRKKAQQSANARWGNDLSANQKHSERNANAAIEQCSPSPTPIITPYIKEPPTPCEDMLKIFIKEALSLSKPERLTAKRKKLMKARWKSIKDLDNWTAICKRIQNSQFLTGHSPQGWRASFDWILNETNFTKIIEGNYDNKEAPEVDTNAPGEDGFINKMNEPPTNTNQ